MFGPTAGDRVRLADTELIVEVERDLTTYGEEVKFGGGKVIRDGMGQSQRMSRDCADTVITNALVIDWWGIVKCDVAIKGGKIAKLGKAGNPDIQPAVDIVIGAATEIIAGEGMIVTAGGIDSHIHFICPQQIDEALMSGITTMIGGPVPRRRSRRRYARPVAYPPGSQAAEPDESRLPGEGQRASRRRSSSRSGGRDRRSYMSWGRRPRRSTPRSESRTGWIYRSRSYRTLNNPGSSRPC
jgi:hypothetical protein